MGDDVSLYANVTRISHHKTRAQFNMALACEKAGRLNEANYYFEKTLLLDPDAFLNLANAYLQLGMISEARTSYLMALKINPDDARIHHNLEILSVKSGAQARVADGE